MLESSGKTHFRMLNSDTIGVWKHRKPLSESCKINGLIHHGAVNELRKFRNSLNPHLHRWVKFGVEESIDVTKVDPYEYTLANLRTIYFAIYKCTHYYYCYTGIFPASIRLIMRMR